MSSTSTHMGELTMAEKIANMSSPLPWFKVFSTHFLADRDYRVTSLEERGLIFSMLLECWSSLDVPTDSQELSQVIGVPKEQVARALTPKVLTFFKTRDQSYFSEYLEKQRNSFLQARSEQIAGGIKGAAIKRSKKIQKEGQPLGEPEGSSNQVNSSSILSSQVNSFSVYQEEGLTDNKLEHHKEWLNDYDNGTTSTHRKLQS